MTPPEIRSGDVLHLSRTASVQFIRPITVRVIRVLADWHTYDGWVWIDAYQLNAVGDAVRRRTLFLMPAGARRPAPQSDRAPTRTVPAPPARRGGATVSRRGMAVPRDARPGRGRASRSAGTP
ncbi:hypothetical protein [Micromonospora sp. RL09-050-HVF-A]|uniref:hypothetical protein n=1 Tax=Micromonospora sp. RL09-050-HVF-A TaxID=1703433 RepID=UPI0035AB733B